MDQCTTIYFCYVEFVVARPSLPIWSCWRNLWWGTLCSSCHLRRVLRIKSALLSSVVSVGYFSSTLLLNMSGACVCVWVWVMCTVWDRLTGIQVKCCCWWWWRLLLLLCSVVGNDGDEGLWHWLRLTICPRSFQSMPPVFRFCRGLIRSWLQQTATSITF